MESIAISTPWRGKNLTIIVLNPRSEAIPTPHVAHPGTNIAKDAPMPPMNPCFPFAFLKKSTLYFIKLKRIPNIILRTIKLMYEINFIWWRKFIEKIQMDFIIE